MSRGGPKPQTCGGSQYIWGVPPKSFIYFRVISTCSTHRDSDTQTYTSGMSSMKRVQQECLQRDFPFSTNHFGYPHLWKPYVEEGSSCISCKWVVAQNDMTYHEMEKLTGFGVQYAGAKHAQQQCAKGIQQYAVNPIVHRECHTEISFS